MNRFLLKWRSEKEIFSIHFFGFIRNTSIKLKNLNAKMNRKFLILGIIHAIVGIGAIPAGFLFLTAPDGSKMGLLVEGW